MGRSWQAGCNCSKATKADREYVIAWAEAAYHGAKKDFLVSWSKKVVRSRKVPQLLLCCQRSCFLMLFDGKKSTHNSGNPELAVWIGGLGI